jgi:ABC-type antimicrobial peptide transport system permease subunit
LTVVGTVVLPGLGTYDGSDKTALGEGAVVTRRTLYRLGADFGRDDFVVRFAADASPGERDRVIAEITALTDPYVDALEVQGLQRPADIVSYDRVRSTPLVLAAVLVVLGFATVAHALVSAVRRRRRDLAMLTTLGMTRRQVTAIVSWQATTFGAVALLIGIPLGVVSGRWVWSLLARDIGTLAESRVPVLALVVGVPVVLLLCNAVAYVPGRMAARLRPAAVLRTE